MSKLPFVTKEQIEEIVKTYPTPFHIYDEKGIRENAKAVQEAFAWNKGFKEYFAVKACPNPFLMEILHEYGAGCDCSSMTELMLSNALGISGDDIMFSSSGTGVRILREGGRHHQSGRHHAHRLCGGHSGKTARDHELPLQPRRRVPDEQRYHGQSGRLQVWVYAKAAL